MWAVFAGVLQPGVQENLDKYYDRPFDVFVSYYDTGIYRLPYEWAKNHGPNKQMDWGSWLYIVDQKGLDELVDPEGRVMPVIPAEEGEECAKVLPPIDAKDMPKDDWYGVLEVECY